MYVSEVFCTPPECFKSELQALVYKTLTENGIEYSRVDTGEAITMEDCVDIGERLECKVVKSLFLCNRQQTNYYLFVTAGDKPFVTKDFGKALGVSRVSFAPSEKLMEIMSTEIGATTVFSLLLGTAANVRLVIDSEVLTQKYYGCTDGTNTGYMRIRTDDLLKKIIPLTNHTAEIIDI